MKKITKEYGPNFFETVQSVDIIYDRRLLFYQFVCPYCKELNLVGKTKKDKVVLCSANGCRRPIQLNNIDQVA
jgi:hypothetical protein